MVALASLVNRAGTMVLPFLVLYMTKNRGMSAGRAGLVMAIYGISALIASPLFGKLSDSWGPVRVMTASLFSSGIVLLLFPLAKSWTAVALATVALSFTSEAFRPSVLSVLSHQATADQRRAAFALLRLAINLGMSIGPAVGGFLAVWNFDSIFWVDGATSLAAGVVLVAVGVRDPRPGEANGETGEGIEKPAPTRSGLRDGRLMIFLAGVFLTTVVFFQHEGALPLFLVHDLHLKESTYGLLFTINTLLIVFLEVPLNLAMASVAHWRSLAGGALLVGAGFGSLYFASGVPSVLATVVVWTFGEMVLFPSMSSYVADLSPNDRRGEYMGFYTMAFALAFSVGPWLGTVVYERFGPNPVWGGALALSMVAALVFAMGRVRSPG